MPSVEALLLEILRRLYRWREYAPSVARAAREILGEDARVYVVGGAAEDRLTVKSDVDIAIVSPRAPRSPRDRLRLAIDIRERAVEKHGLPWDYPVDIHIYTPEEFEQARQKYYRKTVEVEA